jgi:cytidylate kinase
VIESEHIIRKGGFIGYRNHINSLTTHGEGTLEKAVSCINQITRLLSPTLIIIEGPPGSGKSEAAFFLAELLTAPVIEAGFIVKSFAKKLLLNTGLSAKELMLLDARSFNSLLLKNENFLKLTKNLRLQDIADKELEDEKFSSLAGRLGSFPLCSLELPFVLQRIIRKFHTVIVTGRNVSSALSIHQPHLFYYRSIKNTPLSRVYSAFRQVRSKLVISFRVHSEIGAVRKLRQQHSIINLTNVEVNRILKNNFIRSNADNILLKQRALKDEYTTIDTSYIEKNEMYLEVLKLLVPRIFLGHFPNMS